MKDKKNIFALILLLLGFWLLLKKPPGMPSIEQKTQSSINQNLKTTDLSVQLNRALTQKVLVQLRGEAERNKAYSDRPSSFGMKLKQENHAVSVAEENRKNDLSPTYRVQNVDEEILRQVANQQFANNYDEAYREAYVRAFIENARANGLEVSLNQNLDVVDVVPFKVDEPMRFPNSETGPSRSGQ